MNNGMTFGLEGPNITGWWVNPQTGDKFNAVDTFFEDNQLLVKTADGRLLKYNQIQNYIQTDKPDSFTAPTTPTKQSEEIPQEILNELEGTDDGGLLIPDDDIYGIAGAPTAPLGNMYKGVEQPQPKTTDYDIIDRALNGKSILELKGDIIWNNFPQREIEMLIEVMNIPEENIVQYFINSVSLDDVMKSVQDSIRYYIDRMLHPITGPSKETEQSDKESVNEQKEEKPKKTKKKVNG